MGNSSHLTACHAVVTLRMVRDDTTQRCHRLGQDRRPRHRLAGSRSGWRIPPIGSDLAGDADQLRAVTQPVRPATPPPRQLFVRQALSARADRAASPAHEAGGHGGRQLRTSTAGRPQRRRDNPSRPGPARGDSHFKNHQNQRRRCRPFRLPAAPATSHRWHTASRGVVNAVPTPIGRPAYARVQRREGMTPRTGYD